MRLIRSTFPALLFLALALTAGAATTSPKPHILTQISVDKPGKAMPGEVLTYSLVIINQGGDAARRVILSDPIPKGTEYVPGSADSSIAAPEFSLDGGRTWTALPLQISTDGGKVWRVAPASEFGALTAARKKELASGAKVSAGVNRWLKAAPASLITHVRWMLNTLAPGARASLSLKVRVR